MILKMKHAHLKEDVDSAAMLFRKIMHLLRKNHALLVQDEFSKKYLGMIEMEMDKLPPIWNEACGAFDVDTGQDNYVFDF